MIAIQALCNSQDNKAEEDQKLNSVIQDISPIINQQISNEEIQDYFPQIANNTYNSYERKLTKKEKIQKIKEVIKQVGVLGLNISILLLGKYASYYLSPDI